MPLSKPFHIAIIGGGITGVCLGIALSRRRISFTIYERASSFGEIGAGVGVSPNAVRALGVIDPAAMDAWHNVVTMNADPDKRDVWFDFLDGTDATTPVADLEPLFTIRGKSGYGHRAAHRAKFLEELVRLLPPDVARFDKRLVGIEESEGIHGRLTVKFADGSTAEADAVVGCDGIKSRTREFVLGLDHPALKCRYSHKYAWRGLIPMQDAVDILGTERAANATLWVSGSRLNSGMTMFMSLTLSSLI
jgi:salicylate hydroxylase